MPLGTWLPQPLASQQKTSGPTAEDVADAIDIAQQAHSAAVMILDQGILSPW